MGIERQRPRPLRPRPGRRAVLFGALLAVALLATGGLAVAGNVFGAGDRFERLLARVERFLAGPPPDRDTLPTIVVTPPPVAAGGAGLDDAPGDGPGDAPGKEAGAGDGGGVTTVGPPAAAWGGGMAPGLGGHIAVDPPEPSPSPVRAPVDVRLPADPESDFASQLTKDWCAPAGIQMSLAIMDLVDARPAVQREIAGRVREWESVRDSKNGDWGPAAMALALAAYGAPGYEVRAYERREDALRDAAAAIARTGSPAILLAWRGAHTWVMTGYRADADPLRFPDATVTGTYIFDPWYPRISSIWGPSDPPGTFQDAAEMRRNYLPWKRPEGRYPDRDGRFIALVPTIPRPGWSPDDLISAPSR
ncbi:MAG TPA: hypothetical protein VNO86_07685 [Candidatus Binatia bacterium]|nr:hypothetical protein [Candidatus Binatia bacterium]